ncbi:MAG: S1 family peptidase [Terriglobales bacterium]
MTDNLNGIPGPEEPVCDAWQRALQVTFGIFFVAVTIILVYYEGPRASDEDLQAQVHQLSGQVERLKQEEAMPAMVLNRYRDSICYVFGIYRVGFPGRKPSFRARISGSGFVVANGLLATNRHVAEPWYEDAESTALIAKGATPQLEKLLAFFPGRSTPVNITPLAWTAEGDLAILQIDDSEAVRQLRPLPFADTPATPGEIVTVIGYPMGILGMLAKAPPAVYERLALRNDDQRAADELAALSLIRPSATCGHLGDVVGEKLVYDAPTAHGGSGGPVFDSHGKVIGINSAYIDGFSGGTLGIAVEALSPLIDAARKHQLQYARLNSPAQKVSLSTAIARP